MSVKFRVEIPPSIIEATASELEQLAALFPEFLGKRCVIRVHVEKEQEQPVVSKSTPDPTGIWVCKDCGAKYAKANGLGIHRKYKHPVTSGDTGAP
jgi:hypothetical protein